MRALLRPVLLLLIAVTVLLAVVTATGRVIVAWLPQLEPRINSLLRGRGVEITGIEGRWHQLNPIVHVRRLTFAGGSANDVTLEVDVLESALHSTLIARHLSAAHVDLAPVRDSSGHWRLGTGGGEGAGSSGWVEDLLRYSDGLMFDDVLIRFAETAVSGQAESLTPLGEVRTRVVLANTGLRHSGGIVVHVERGGAGDVKLAYNLSDAWFGRPTYGEVEVASQSFTMDPALGVALGGFGARIDRLQGHWSFTGSSSTGQLTLSARDLQLSTGALQAADLSVRGSTGRLGLRWNLVFDRLAIVGRHGAARLDNAVVAIEKGLNGWNNVDITLPSFDAAPVLGVVRDAAASVHGVEEWLGGLNPRGRVDGMQARFGIDDHNLDYVATISDLAIENFKGVPYVRNGAATVAGTEHSVEVNLNSNHVALGFLDYFDRPTHFDHIAGTVLVWFVPGYLAVQVRDLVGTFDSSSVHGAFAFARPDDVLEQRLLLTLRVRDIDGRGALALVPRELPQALRDGLDQAIVSGQVDRADLVYHGHLRTIEGLPMRQAELSVVMHDGVVRFHPDWPAATDVAGHVSYTARGTTGVFDRGNLAGFSLANATVFLPQSVAYVDFRGTGSGDGAALRKLIDTSPLSTWLSFVKPDWSFSGPFQCAADLKVPIASGVTPNADLRFDLNGLTAGLGDMKIELGALRGKLRYSYPTTVTGRALTGRLFEYPVRFDVASEDGQVRIKFSGKAGMKQITDWRAVPNPGLADGEFDYTGEYRIRPGSNEPAILDLRSDLQGVALALPAPLGKLAEEVRPSTLKMTFAGDSDRLDFGLGNVADGWLRIDDGSVRGGSIGLGVDAAVEQGDEDVVTVEGGLDNLDLTDRLRGGETQFYPSFPWAMSAFKIGRVTFDSFEFDDVVVDARNGSGELDISVTSPNIAGSMALGSDAPPKIDLQYLKLPAGKPGGGVDPLESFDPHGIIDLDVAVGSIVLGDENFGAWRFGLRKSDRGVSVENLIADVKGLHIESPEGTQWSATDESRTHFKGTLHAGDLAKVLPQWNYAPSLETTSTDVDADIDWLGSPLNFALPRIVGKLSVKAEKGRFVDLGEGSGAMRIFSLLNFAAIAKRMTLDFSDVFGKGISFDEITGSVMANQGVIRFVEPLDIDGTGGDFRINGTVNLLTGVLDNEMIVTLPVSSSLPWYAAYLGFVNPVAAGAVLLGERLLRNQIDKMSSAKYKVSGTLQNPKVDFQEVFPKAMSKPSEKTAEAAPTEQQPAKGKGTQEIGTKEKGTQEKGTEGKAN